jgi:hypothetical protein
VPGVIAPATRLAALRLLTGAFAVGYLLVRTPHLLDVADLPAGRFDPVGVLKVLDDPFSPGTFALVLALTIAAGAAYLAGWRFRVTGPAFALLLLVVTSYRNSWGQVFHTENLLVLHVLIVGLAPAADAWAWDARHRPPPPDAERYGWPVRLAALVTVLTYFVTGVAKLRYAGGDWLAGDTLLHQVAFDNARKVVFDSPVAPLAAVALGHSWLFAPMGAFTLLVELGAPLALLGRRAAAVWATAAWLFHAGILALMAILFPYPLLGVAFAPLFRCERPIERLRTYARRRGGRGASAAAGGSGDLGGGAHRSGHLDRQRHP